MTVYQQTLKSLWTGRISEEELYLHEKVKCVAIEAVELETDIKSIVLLGYACDEGVKLNQGRIGAAEGADAIRTSLGKLPNHLAAEIQLFDAGTINCVNQNLEETQEQLSEKITFLLSKKTFPIVLGGGHDMAYGHYKGIKNHLGDKKIGIINFDAHFDLRSNENGNNSGTPFYQIAQNCKAENTAFNYLCLGIRKENNHFNMHYLEHVQLVLIQFMEDIDYLYTTIDLDGFSSAYAPGVSAASPVGFSPDIVLESLKVIIDSKKLISLDIAEMNPKYDSDQQTAKLASSLVHFVLHKTDFGNS
jgi:formiminoglutamase